MCNSTFSMINSMNCGSNIDVHIFVDFVYPNYIYMYYKYPKESLCKSLKCYPKLCAKVCLHVTVKSVRNVARNLDLDLLPDFPYEKIMN